MSTYLRVTSDLNADKSVLFSKFGIKGDGKAFDDKGVSTLVGAAEDCGTVHLGGNPQMLLGQALTISNRAGLRLTTDREPNTETRGSAPCFLWGGAAGGDMLVLDRCRNVTLDGFVFETDDFFRARAAAGRAIVLDGGQDTNPESNAFGTTCTLKRLRHVTYPGALDVEATFITIAEVTKRNQEFHEIDRCGGNGNGRGKFLRIGPSYNAKNIKLQYSRYIDCYRRGVELANGSVKLLHNNMNRNEWDLYLGASTGKITEEHHIGEGSIHHAFVNCPYDSIWGTYDHSRTRSRTLPMPDLPVPSDEVGLTYEEAWIMFGGQAADVVMERFYLGSPPAPDTRVFGWMNDRSFGCYELRPGWLGRGHCRATLGIDDASLKAIAGNPDIRFKNRVTDTNPGGPGIVDLPSGQLRLCEGKVTLG